MKKNDWILIATLALYSFLFYKESAGINFVIFNLVLISALLIRDNQLLKSKAWLLTASASMLSALCVGYYGNGLSITANVISLSVLSALSYRTGTSVIVSLLFSLYSYASAIVFMFLDWRQRIVNKQRNSPIRKWSLIILPILITLIFFFMYKSSNALFNDFTKNINLDFISGDWILSTLGGFILLYGFFYHQKIKSISTLDENASNEIDAFHSKTITLFGKEISISDEEFSGKLLFLLLNLLLFVVNILDIQFMFIDNKLPKGVTYSEFVHQGTGMLITSIVLAIAIILFYFRGGLNFSDRNKAIKTLAYIWIIQNAFMILSTMFRNNMYVTEYGLTYKRIGVYVYLLLTLIGLITTFIKIKRIKSTAYLFRINGWIFYTVLVCSAVINWDRFIADFNIHKAKQVQVDYLLDLSYTVLPQLYSYHNNGFEQTDMTEGKVTSASMLDFDRQRDWRLYLFMEQYDQLGWKSWYYDKKETFDRLQYLNAYQKIEGLNLAFTNISSIEPLYQFNTIRSLNLSGNKIASMEELKNFKILHRLNIQKNNLTSLKGIESLSSLEMLNIRQNQIVDYSPLFVLKKLKKLYVNDNIQALQYEALQKNLPEAEIIKS